MPPREVAEAERLHDLTEEVDRLFVLEGVVEGHGYFFSLTFGVVYIVSY